MTLEKRQPWDGKRLIETLSYFRVIPFIGTLSWLAPVVPMNIINLNAVSPLLFDFRDPRLDLRETWGAIDDVVMGGVSESQMTLENGAALFSGVVSTANSGGFASVRTRNFSPPLDLSPYQGVDLRIRGDGQRYKFLIRTTQSWDGLAYSYSFNTVAQQWITQRIPFSELRPVFRAKTVENAAPFKQSQVISFQMMLSKFEYDGTLNPQFQAGRFQLKVETIAAYR